MRAGVAVHAVAFHLAVRAGLAVRAVAFPLAMRARGSPRSRVSACHARCSPRSASSACYVGRGCSPRTPSSPCHAGRGCSPRSCTSACHAGSPCSPRSRTSPCREGMGCTPRTCTSPSRASTVSFPWLPRERRAPPSPRAGTCATRAASWLFKAKRSSWRRRPFREKAKERTETRTRKEEGALVDRFVRPGRARRDGLPQQNFPTRPATIFVSSPSPSPPPSP